jgi:hypothetical protein
MTLKSVTEIIESNKQFDKIRNNVVYDKIYNVPVKDVAFALALRIIDEWEGFDDNKPLLQNALESMLKDNPKICEKLWDSGIIEADYFENLD